MNGKSYTRGTQEGRKRNTRNVIEGAGGEGAQGAWWMRWVGEEVGGGRDGVAAGGMGVMAIPFKKFKSVAEFKPLVQ